MTAAEVTGAADALAAILQSVPARLGAISDSAAACRSTPGHWSKKEILGHLIDSATNNHQRFVRAQLVPRLDFPGYEQASWVRSQAYATEPWPDLVNLWLLLNRHLLHVIRSMPEAAFSHEIAIGGKPPLTLSALIADYLSHLNHHLDQVLN
jgi:hypothetical protein